MRNNDLISRAAAIAEIEEYIEEYSELEPKTGYHNLKWCAMEEAKDVLSMLPAVDAAPVVHGEWIDDADPGEIVGEHWMCSNCEMVFGMPEDTMRIHRYCPYCGARMDAPTCGPDYCEIGGGDDEKTLL